VVTLWVHCMVNLCNHSLVTLGSFSGDCIHSMVTLCTLRCDSPCVRRHCSLYQRGDPPSVFVVVTSNLTHFTVRQCPRQVRHSCHDSATQPSFVVRSAHWHAPGTIDARRVYFRHLGETWQSPTGPARGVLRGIDFAHGRVPVTAHCTTLVQLLRPQTQTRTSSVAV